MLQGLGYWAYSQLLPNPISKVELSKTRMQCAEHVIHDVASEVSSFVHHLVRISYTAEYNLRLESDSFVGEMLVDLSDQAKANYLNNVQASIERMRDDMVNYVIEQKTLGVPSHCALMQGYCNYLINVITSNMGNCAEKALLVGIFVKALMTTSLQKKGFSKGEVDAADIRIVIADNGNHDGDHTVCLLNYKINGQKSLVVDSWMGGVVYNAGNAQQLFDDTFVFDNVLENKTLAANDEECVNTIMNAVREVYAEDPHFLRLCQLVDGQSLTTIRV